MTPRPVATWRLQRPGLTVPVSVDPTGRRGPTRAQSRGRRWRRTSWGLYVPASVTDEQVEQRIVEAAAVLPPGGGVTGWAALRWRGGLWFSGLTDGGRSRRPVDLAVNIEKVRHQPGLVVSEEFVRPGEMICVDGLPLTTPARSVCFEMRHARDVRRAVEALDMASYHDLVSIREARTYAGTLKTWTGIPQCRAALMLADENSWSPQETRFRLAWVLDAGLPPPLCNRPVFDRWGRHVGTPDLLDVESGLVGEYDGRLHLAGAQRRRDRDREDRYRNLGLEVVVVLAEDFVDRQRVVDLVVTARSRARGRAAGSWSVDPPPGWTATHTVEQRRALDDRDRVRLLGHRLRTG